MRINVYSQELTPEVLRIEKESNTGLVYQAAQLILHSSDRLHHPPADDDRSAVTFWLPTSEHRREEMAQAFERVAAIFRGDTALAQRRVPDAVRLCAKPQQWTEDGVAWPSGWREWSEGLMGYHISFDPQEESDNRYIAACGEGEPESFATLEEAQQWCQSDADDWIRKIAMIDQQQEARGNGE